MDSIWTGLRVVVSLAAVLGLVWVLAQAARRRGVGGAATAEGFAVIGRHALGRTAGVAVVRVGDQALVLGVTEHSVRLLAQTALSDVVPAVGAVTAGPVRETLSAGALPAGALPAGALVPARALTPGGSLAPRGALAGSALSPATWSRALEVLRERSTRR